MKKNMKVRDLVLVAIFSSVAAILMFFKFPLPFMPPFMSFDLALVPELVGSFILGPLLGMLIPLVKILVKIVTMGSDSMFTGEIINVLLSWAFIVPATIIYLKYKTKRSAIIGVVCGTISMIIVATFTNLLIIMPFYAKLYGLKVDDLVKMSGAVNPLIKTQFSFVLFGLVPFNLIKGISASMVTILIYPKLKVLLKKEQK